MRQKFLILIAVLLGGLAIHNAQAQNVVEKGVSIVNVGVGINDGALPINLSYDYGVIGNLFDNKSALTLGGLAGVLVGKNESGLIIGPRVGLHYHFIPKLDTYLSVMLGYNSIKAKYNNNGGFDWGTHLGARYMFTPSVGGFLELGYGWSFANIGVAFRF